MAGNSPDDLEMAADGRLVCNPESCSVDPEACELEVLVERSYWRRHLKATRED